MKPQQFLRTFFPNKNNRLQYLNLMNRTSAHSKELTNVIEGYIDAAEKDILDKVYDMIHENDITASTINNLKSWSLAESFSISSPTFDAAGNISGGTITWPDGNIGSISNVVTGTHGITSIRYNRSDGKYATVNIAYDGSGVVNNQEVVLTGF